MQSKAPSRFVCVISKEENLPPQFLELVTFRSSAPLFVSNNQFARSVSDMSIVLAINKESLIIDPIDWGGFKKRLLQWSGNWPPGLVTISEETNALFTERTQPLHPPRSLTKHANTLPNAFSIINFFDAYAPKKPSKLDYLPLRCASLNKHPTFLGLLGSAESASDAPQGVRLPSRY